MTDSKQGRGKTALVTGSSRGIGRGIAEALAERGWTVGIHYRSNREAAEQTLAAVRDLGGDGFCVAADIADPGTHKELVDEVLRRTGRIDLLVNNAGIAPRIRADLFEVSPESYDEVLDTNLRGPFFLTQRVAREMVRAAEKNTEETPVIITITSISAAAVSPERGEYCVSKAGLSMMSSLWAARLAGYGIRVYEVRPGIIETDMTAGVREKYDRLIEEGLVPLHRWGTPRDVGRTAVALAEGALPYSTGEVLYVDGGMHVPRL